MVIRPAMLLAFLGLLWLSGSSCHEGSGQPVDAGTDAGMDAGMDGEEEGLDAMDSGIDAGIDVSMDTGPDGGVDSCDDQDSDVGADPGQPVLILGRVDPPSGGASVATPVILTGQGFGTGLQVWVGGIPGTDATVLSVTEARVVFQPVALPERGLKDVRVSLAGQEATLPGGFEYLFDEDPIVFVHGYMVNSSEWDTMIEWFKQAGYPDDALFAIDYTSSVQSNVINARDELPPFVDGVLQQTGAPKVDLVAHSNGGMSTRLWIGTYGGQDKVRDYVTLSGTHHGTSWACNDLLPGDSAKEQCPVYAQQDESFNLVQWILNGDPETADVDETPFGTEDGGGISYSALWTESDLIDIPPDTCCLDQTFKGDCGDPINLMFSGISHLDMVKDEGVFQATLERVQRRNRSKP